MEPRPAARGTGEAPATAGGRSVDATDGAPSRSPTEVAADGRALAPASTAEPAASPATASATEPVAWPAAGQPGGVALPVLDGLRAFAALLVAAYHAWLLSGEARLDGGPLRDALSSGFFAVSFFFVLSGFVLFWPVARRGGGSLGPLRGYARRRIARVVPAYWAVLAIGALSFGALTASGTLADATTPGSIVAHLALVHNEARLIPGYEGTLGLGVNPALWTLSIEAAFYVALPFAAARFARHPLAWVLAAFAATAAARLVLAELELSLSDRTQSLLLSASPLAAADFAAGMGAAWWVARTMERRAARRHPPAAWAAAVTAAALVVLALMVAAGGPDGGAVRHTARTDVLLAAAMPLAFAALAAALALAPLAVQRPLTNRVVRWLGAVSYGIFLSHFLFIGLARNTLGFAHDGSNAAFAAMLPFVLAGATLYGALSWIAIERPARRWARR